MELGISMFGDNHYDEIMMPMCFALTERCDAVLRIGGKSLGADEEVEKYAQRGLPIYRQVSEIPTLSL